MFHLIAFEGAVGQTANTEIPGVFDQIAQNDGNYMYFQEDMNLYMAFVSAATITRARLTSPKLRQVYIPYLFPISAALLPPDKPNVVDMRRRPMVLRRLERFVPEITSGVACGTEVSYGVLAFSAGLEEAPFGEVTTLRATSTTTATAKAWSDVALTFDQQLADGRYAIIGAQVQSTTVVAYRFILSNQVMRPGGLGQAAIGSRSHEMFENGGLGKWGEFVNTNLPRLQVLCNAADNAFEVKVQVVRIGSN